MGDAAFWSLAAARVGLPFGAALAGGLIGALGGGRNRTAAGLAVHFAAGAFLALVFLHLLPESGEQAGWAPAFVALAVGWTACAGVTRRSGAACPGCATGHTHNGQLTYGVPLLAVVALHSTMDGLALAGAVGHGHAGELLSLAVLAHKLPEGMAVAAVCRAGGQSAARALGLTALVQSGTAVGFLAGVWLFQLGPLLLGLGLGVVAGSLLYLVFLTFRAEREAEHPVLNVSMAAAGALLVLAAHAAAGTGH